jgi:hypothetical protein
MDLHVNIVSLFKKEPTTSGIWRRAVWHISINVSEESTASLSRQARTLKMEAAGEIISPQPTV